MKTEFLFNGPLRTMEFRYSGPPWVFLATVIVVALVIFGMIVVKRLLEL